jgi:small subunit ribosomal protein S4e|tara:strand:- start:335 stop:1030 length:696 start_codon:yes stop_codon:yes gene_type:complete
VSDHLKRITVPRSWNIGRKAHFWATKPEPGPHSLEGSVPLVIVLRDYLHVCDTAREARRILGGGKVLLDQRVVRDPKRGVGLMDVISLPAVKTNFRCLLDHHGRLHFSEIKATAAKWKLLRVEGKTTLRGGKTQLNLHDGSNLLSDEDVSTGDVLQLTLPGLDVKKILKFSKGAPALVTGGAHVGTIAPLEEAVETRSPRPNIVRFAEFETLKQYAFVVGAKKALVTEVAV